MLPISTDLRAAGGPWIEPASRKDGLRGASQVMVDGLRTVRFSGMGVVTGMGVVIGSLDGVAMRAITRQMAIVLGSGGHSRPTMA